MEDFRQWLGTQKFGWKSDCPLMYHCSFRTGGTAPIALFPKNREETVASVRELTRRRIPYAVVGRGSNLLFPDGRLRGVIVFTGDDSDVVKTDTGFTVSAGTPLPLIAKLAAEQGLAGMEFAAGIPGSVGGALVTNAGAFGGCMEQIVLRSFCYDPARDVIRTFTGKEHRFSYRSGIYAEHPEYVILGAQLCLRRGDPGTILERMRTYRAARMASQPWDKPSAGSVFRHPPGERSAGELIDRCGLKGLRLGGAEVSRKHAGFIVNTQGAESRDILELTKIVRESVFAQTGIRLEREIRLVGYDF